MGKWFFLSDNDEDVLYRVVGQGYDMDDGEWFQIKYDDCGGDTFKVLEEHMMDMLRDSLLLEV